LEEVGQEIGLTRERVRQIQVEALRRLREILEKEGLSASLLFK
jgi:RNA polymerase nonessential primary-like sigma factor